MTLITCANLNSQHRAENRKDNRITFKNISIRSFRAVSSLFQKVILRRKKLFYFPLYLNFGIWWINTKFYIFRYKQSNSLLYLSSYYLKSLCMNRLSSLNLTIPFWLCIPTLQCTNDHATYVMQSSTKPEWRYRYVCAAERTGGQTKSESQPVN